MNASIPAIEAQRLSRAFDKRIALDRVSLEINARSGQKGVELSEGLPQRLMLVAWSRPLRSNRFVPPRREPRSCVGGRLLCPLTGRPIMFQ